MNFFEEDSSTQEEESEKYDSRDGRFDLSVFRMQSWLRNLRFTECFFSTKQLLEFFWACK